MLFFEILWWMQVILTDLLMIIIIIMLMIMIMIMIIMMIYA